MAIGVGSYVRFAVGTRPPPGQEINANSAMLVTAMTQNERGGMVSCSRQGRYVGTWPQTDMVEVRAP
jgi:hypothetical protein